MNSGDNRSAVILVGHGTREERGTQEFFQLGQLLARQCHPMPVESALLEFERPTLIEAWQTLASQGIDHLHIAPLLLFAAGHAKNDIPGILAECSTSTPHITYDQCRPLSRHPAILDLVRGRIAQTITRNQRVPSRTAVILVGRGNRDACAQTDLRVLSELVRHRMDLARIEVAFYAMAEPKLSDVLDRMGKACLSGNFDTVIVAPHLLFHGRLFEAISRQTVKAAERFPGARWFLADYLGPDKRVAEAVYFRIFGRENSAWKPK